MRQARRPTGAPLIIPDDEQKRLDRIKKRRAAEIAARKRKLEKPDPPPRELGWMRFVRYVVDGKEMYWPSGGPVWVAYQDNTMFVLPEGCLLFHGRNVEDFEIECREGARVELPSLPNVAPVSAMTAGPKDFRVVVEEFTMPKASKKRVAA